MFQDIFLNCVFIAVNSYPLFSAIILVSKVVCKYCKAVHYQCNRKTSEVRLTCCADVKSQSFLF